ncbi:ammonium transporter Rh type A isoform X1 [Periplaneta americana]
MVVGILPIAGMATQARDMVLLLVLQVIFIVAFAFYTQYDTDLTPTVPPLGAPAFDHYYPLFQDVHVMVFIGFGFLMTFLKRYGFSAIGFNLLIAALNVQWSILCSGFFHHGGDSDHGRIKIGIQNLLSADLATAALLISYGAVLGKTTPLQLVIMGLIETAMFTANEHLGLEVLKVRDSGGSIFVHAFGAYFGLGVSLALGHGRAIGHAARLEKEGSSYTSDTFAMIGTVFLWLFWPSFNSALIDGELQHRAIINTYLSLTACCVTAFAASSLVSHEKKFDMVHIQNATLAGGVAIGTACDMMIYPYGALLVGVIAGTLSVIGYHYIQPFLLKTITLHDTCGVHNLHGMPGVLAGIIGAILAGMATETQYGSSLYEQFPARGNSSHVDDGMGRTAGGQAGYQLLAVAITLGIGLIGGVLTGLIIKIPALNKLTKEEYFDDSLFWEMPPDMEVRHQPEPNKREVEVKTVEAFVYDNSRPDTA